ncbi:xanthine dehydrogenase family protein subunit M, partial [Mesorhizobium sp. M1A.F.Ca.IN.020.32.1.1]
ASEAELIGKEPSRPVFEAAARLAADGARPATGNHYKVELLQRTIVRTLEMVGEMA